MKKKVEIFHSNTLCSPFSDENPSFPSDYKKVADLEVETDENILDVAYEMSQNFYSSWLMKNEVKSDLLHCRSTSYGDVIKNGDDYFKVDTFGFKQI